MSRINPSPPTTLQMVSGNHIPAGVVCYGCKCKTLAVIPSRGSAWIIKRCGRVLRAAGDRVDLRVLHGDLVGEHFGGHTTFPSPAIESLLRRMGHRACAIHVDTRPVKRTMVIHMEGHRFDVHFGTHGVVSRCFLGNVLIRGSEAA